jgi:putative DNA primase/helicase
LWGKGSNGKSTFLVTLQELLCKYAKQAAPDLLLRKQSDRHPTEIADIFGARFLACIESGEERRLNETLIKQMSGGDKMKARRMREDFWEFNPTHKVWLATNHKPAIRGTDYAIWRRIRLIPFQVTFHEPGAGDPEQDKTLITRLHTELPGILRWAVEGCLLWQQEGLQQPEVVRKTTSEYRTEQDVFGQFISECCVTGRDQAALASLLYSKYKCWCVESGERVESQKQFGSSLRERGFEGDNRGGKSWWYGIGLQDTPPSSTDSTAGDSSKVEPVESEALKYREERQARLKEFIEARRKSPGGSPPDF